MSKETPNERTPMISYEFRLDYTDGQQDTVTVSGFATPAEAAAFIRGADADHEIEQMTLLASIDRTPSTCLAW